MIRLTPALPDSLSQLHRKISNDHLQLIAMAARLDVLKGKSGTDHKTSEILCELVDYTRDHFLNEEQLMDAIDFKDADYHVAEHWKFIGAITVFISEYERGTLKIKEIAKFIRSWFEDHINTHDRYLCECIFRADQAEIGLYADNAPALAA
jgi:hemerythrin-like metal-binding protein